MAISLLILKIFNPVTTVLLSLALQLLIVRVCNFKLELRDSRFSWHIWLLIALALILRFRPYQYIMGGQDQGTYVNIAHQYIRNGQLKYKDAFREGLTPEQKELYDKHNPYLMPSIKYWDRAASEYTMEFYPLHPAWLAMFEAFVGKNLSTLALTFFSILSIIGFYLLGYEIAGRKKLPGYLAALLVAISPSHVFFSKLPVSEMLAVYFIVFTAYYLYRFIEDKGANTRNLVLSAALFNCFCYTRMSSFLYIPIVILLAACTILFTQEFRLKKALLLYFVALIGMVGNSLAFYYYQIPPLFHLVYSGTLQKILGQEPVTRVTAYTILTIASLGILYYLSNQNRLTKLKTNILQYYRYFFVLGLLAVIGLNFYKLAEQSFTPANFPDFVLERQWYVYRFAWEKVKYILAYTMFAQVGPLLLGIFAILPLLKLPDKLKPKFMYLWLFILFFFAVNTEYIWTIRYYYYDFRYFFSELIPYIIALAGTYLGIALAHAKKTRVVLLSCLVLIIGYFSVFTGALLQGPEMGYGEVYNKLNASVTANDLLLLYRGHSDESKPQRYFDNFSTFTMGPFKYYYDLNTFILDTPQQLQLPQIAELTTHYAKTYLLSDRPLQLEGVLTNEQKLTHYYSHYNLAPDCSPHTYEFLPITSVTGINLPDAIKCMVPPTHYYTRSMPFYFYELDSLTLQTKM